MMEGEGGWGWGGSGPSPLVPRFHQPTMCLARSFWLFPIRNFGEIQSEGERFGPSPVCFTSPVPSRSLPSISGAACCSWSRLHFRRGEELAKNKQPVQPGRRRGDQSRGGGGGGGSSPGPGGPLTPGAGHRGASSTPSITR